MNSHTRCPSSFWVTLQQRTTRLEVPAACKSCAPTLRTLYSLACSAAQHMRSASAVHLCHSQGMMLVPAESTPAEHGWMQRLLHMAPP